MRKQLLFSSLIGGLCLLFMSAGIPGVALGADLDAKNLDAVRAERARIDEKFKDDPVGKTKALRDLTERMAVANGNGAMVAEQRRLAACRTSVIEGLCSHVSAPDLNLVENITLYAALIEKSDRLLEEKYGSFHSVTISLPMGGQAFKMTDHDGWRGLFERNKHVVQATLFLDKTRYTNAKPTHVVIQLRSAGVSAANEGVLFAGGSGPETFRMTLVPELAPNGTFVVSFSVPDDQLGRFVLQVSADIEPSLSTNTVVPIILR